MKLPAIKSRRLKIDNECEKLYALICEAPGKRPIIACVRPETEAKAFQASFNESARSGQRCLMRRVTWKLAK